MPQSLDLCDIENSDFNEKLNEIVAWIEHGEFLRYREELETLRKRLKPESFQDRLQELITQPFKGREWLFKEIDAWGKEEGSPRIFSIIGGPGFGKSTFAANLRSRFPDKIAAAQFIEWKKNKLNSPKQIIKNLAFQLATRLGQYRLRLLATTESADLDELDEGSFFSKLLSEPLSFENPNQGWILLDALDEATGPDGQNPFVQTLMRNREQLPPWLKIIVTTRRASAPRRSRYGWRK